MTLEAGRKLGPYEILSPIGKGGMGEVYRARDTRLDRDVAIKVLPEATSRDELALTRFTREAKAVAALSHPNILAIYDVGETDGIAYVVTELLEGETLRERLTQTHLAWRQALEFAATIADGLAAAHAKGVIHRDLKPENVFLTNDGVVKLLDFGLARLESPTPSTDPANTPTMTVATAPGAVMGTIHYMSPEQVRGLKTDAQSDIFSFGCVLYEMVSGERAFQGKTAADTMTAILREEPESVTASVRGVGPELDRLVVRCLDKKAERRFHSASDLAFTLRAMLSDSGSTPTATPTQRQATRIGGMLGNVFVAGLILVVGFLGWREWSQTPTPTGGPIRRIAVLPLENRSGDPDQEVYADAMTEAITDALAQVSALHVISPRAMLRLKGTDLTIPELAEKLNVDAIVDASRIQIGGKIQVRARLVEGATERQIWSDHYERDVRDVFAMQNEIALAIAEGVKVRLTPTEQAMLADAPTIDPPAYDLYVEGLNLVRQKTKNSCLAALALFDRALEINPGFAPAHVGRAEAYYELASTYMHPRDALPQVEQAAKAALALDPNLPEAHMALGDFELLQNWNWSGAEVYYQRALDINPSHSAARLAYALYLTSMKRFDEAKQHLDRVQESDPDAKKYWSDYGGVAFMSRDYQRVVRDSLEALKANPDFWPALQWMGLAREQLGQMTEAIHDLRKAHRIGKSPQLAAMLGAVLANSGETQEARAIRKKLKAEKFESYVCPYEVATISIGLKEYDQACDEIGEACDDRAKCIPWMQADPRLDPIRHLPKFNALLRRVGFQPEKLTATAIPQEIRLAVLPFKDQSANPKQWFADSMTGELIAALAKVKALNVRSRTSSMQYKNSNKPLPQIARELNANMVIDATVRDVGGRIRITVELIDAANDTPVWSGTYTREDQDVLALQDEVARSIAEGIQLELSPQEERRLSGAAPVDPAAYDAYLQGRFFLRNPSVENSRKARAQFDKAIRINPDFALAYAGLADALTAQETFYQAPHDVMPKARAASLKAIELDETLAEAHASLGRVLLNYDWEWDAAEREFLRALELNPGLSNAHLGYARYLAVMGRFDEAIPHLNQAREYDPYSVASYQDYGLVYMLARDFDAMVDVGRRGVALAPQSWVGHSVLGEGLALKGEFDESVSELIKAGDLNPNPAMVGDLGIAYSLAGMEPEARNVLKELDRMGETAFVCPYRTGAIYIGLGEFDAGFENLGQACEDRSDCMPLINYDPRLDPIRNDSRFDALVDCVGLEHKPLSLSVTSPPARRTTLAILPFQQAGTDPDAAFLADEIPASIIDRLAKLSNLQVIPRSTAFRYDAKNEDATSAGKRLSADFVLTGQISARGEDLRIRAQLIDVGANAELWGDRFDRRRDDIIEIEEDLVRQIADALRIQVTGEERAGLSKRDTVNPDAYQAYLQGRFWWNRRSESGFEQAIRFFEEATRIDPSYAAAFAGKADCYCLMGWYYRSPRETIPKAKAAIDAAIALDATSAEAYATQGLLRLSFDWDWAGAERAFLRAIELDPSYASAHHWYMILLADSGRFDEAKREIDIARDLDPGSAVISKDVAFHLTFQRRFEDAAAELERARRIDPTFVPVYLEISTISMLLGDYDTAIEAIETIHRLAGRIPLSEGHLGMAYAKSGQPQKARAELDLMTERSKDHYVPASAFVRVHVGLGEIDEAFTWLNRACDAREGVLIMLAMHPAYDPLRGDSRFDALMRRVGFDPVTRKPMSSAAP